jgi:hypothetical protein
MNLPLVLDIALGLIFIYLILSLLASEIQELITTLLQWRAEHLKRSIEVLLSGGNEADPTYRKLTNDLYSNPLIKGLNQEAKGKIARFFRLLGQRAGDIYRGITGTRNVFGEQRSGPSYMPAESFAAALLQQLDIEQLSQKLSEQTITEIVEEKLKLVEEVLESLRNSVGDDSLLENEFHSLSNNLHNIAQDFIRRRATLSTSVDLVIEQLSRFIDNTEALLADNDYCREIIRGRLPYLKQSIFLRKLEPTVAEAIALILDRSKQTNLSSEVSKIIARINGKNPELPKELKDSLVALAKEAQIKANNLDDGVLQLQREVEAWFDRSMERSTGVYRRNAKGIAILIGFILAASTNADTFHIVNRLSRDTILRNAITQAAEQVVAQTTPSTSASLSGVAAPTPVAPEIEQVPPPAIAPGLDDPALTEPGVDESTGLPDEAIDSPVDLPPEEIPGGIPANPGASEAIQTDLQSVKTAVDNVLQGLPLPIGWNEVNVGQQALESEGWFFPPLRRILGWFITGLALSMGANFWYDLLSKVVRVRNSGRARNSQTEEID